MEWKKGRGKLGLFTPVLGAWICNRGSNDSQNPECTRHLEKILDGKYILLKVSWDLGNKTYDEMAMIGTDKEKNINFWSFTSDGKNSQGYLADVSDIHPQAIGFEAQMPAGLARQAYYPHEEEGFIWVVESKTRKGWNRFTQQHFLRMK